MLKCVQKVVSGCARLSVPRLAITRLARCHQSALLSPRRECKHSGGNMDSTSNSVTAPRNLSHSSPIDSVNNNTMQNGIVTPSGESEDTDEIENVNSSVRNRTSVNGGVALGSVGNVSGTSADRDRNVNNDTNAKPEVEDDKELEELAKLRCQSVATEVVAERYKRRCSDYPGFAFGSSIFSSNTMMKFSIIKNELHNIMNVQLKRVSTFASMFGSECWQQLCSGRISTITA